MKLLFASDSFKGSLTSEKTVELLSRAAREVFGECECSGVPVADGGEGTVEAVIAAEHGEYINVKVHGPLMEETESFYGTFDGNKAVIEMAAASGLPMVPEELRNPLNTTTFGTGELILDALKRGYRDISIAIGGSATNVVAESCDVFYESNVRCNKSSLRKGRSHMDLRKAERRNSGDPGRA